jgi:hypothetical protein
MKVAVVARYGWRDNAKVLEERNFPVTDLPFLKNQLEEKKSSLRGKKYKVVSMQSAIGARARPCFLLAEKLLQWRKICWMKGPPAAYPSGE